MIPLIPRLLAALMLSLLLGLPAWAAPLKVFVPIPPLKSLAEAVGGSRVVVSVLVPPGADPHTFEPKPRQMTELARARAYFALGMPFEEILLSRIARTTPSLKVLRVDRGIPRIPMEGPSHEEEEAQEGHHHEEGLDPHVWLSPRNGLVLVQNLRDDLCALDPAGAGTYRRNAQGLISLDPAGAATYRRNAEALSREIRELDRDLSSLLAPRKGMTLLVFHPAWGYFCRDYGLVQLAVEAEGKEPKPAQMKALIDQGRERKVKVLFVQPQISSKSAATLAKALNARVVKADPLAEDWLGNLRRQARIFREALK